MIGRGSGATVEKEMTNSFDENQNIDWWENQRIGRKIKDKSNYPSATVENQTTDPSATVENQTKDFQFRHASNAFKGSEKAWSYSGLLQVLKGETKQLSNDRERKWCNDGDRNEKFLWRKPKYGPMRKPTGRKENKRQKQLSIRNGRKPNHRSVRNGGKPNQILPIQACFKCIQRQQ